MAFYLAQTRIEICFDIRLVSTNGSEQSAIISRFVSVYRASRRNQFKYKINRTARCPMVSARRWLFRQKSPAFRLTCLPRQSNVRLNNGNSYYHTENSPGNVAAVQRETVDAVDTTILLLFFPPLSFSSSLLR